MQLTPKTIRLPDALWDALAARAHHDLRSTNNTIWKLLEEAVGRAAPAARPAGQETAPFPGAGPVGYVHPSNTW